MKTVFVREAKNQLFDAALPEPWDDLFSTLPKCVAAAKDPSLPEEAVLLLAGFRGWQAYDLMEALCARMALSDEVCRRLASRKNATILSFLLERAELPAEVFAHACGHHDPDVRRCAAPHRRLGESGMRRLSGDGDTNVRAALAVNPNLPCDLAERLAFDKKMGVRLRLASRVDFPHLLFHLASANDNADVQRTALNTLRRCGAHERMDGFSGFVRRWPGRRAAAAKILAGLDSPSGSR